MTAAHERTAPPDPLAIEPEAAGGSGFRQMLPTLGFEVALPVAVFYLLTRFGASTLWALIAGGFFPLIGNLRAWARSRRLEPVGLITIAFLVIGATASLISGSVFFVQIKDSFLTATFGFLCLGSLLMGRPLMFHIMRPFVAGGDPGREAWWDSLWQYARFRAVLRLVTTIWGVCYLIEALARVGFALVLPPSQVVVISPVMTFSVMLALMTWTRRYMLAFRRQRLRERAEASQGQLEAEAQS